HDVGFPPLYAGQPPGHCVCFRGIIRGPPLTDLVKVFGCRQAYENRPSTNPRAAWAGLWGFLVLPGGVAGGAGVAMGRRRRGERDVFVRRAMDRQIAAADSQCFRPYFGEGHAPGNWPERGCFGVT